MDEATVQSVLDDWRTAPIREPLRAALGLLHATNQQPAAVPVEALAACRAQGLSTEAIEDVANVGFHFEFINRVADALDFPLPDERQKPRVTRMLDRAGRLFGGTRAEPSWCVGDDGVVRPVEVEEGRTLMLTVEGVTPPQLRRAVEAHVARARGVSSPGEAVPESVAAFLDPLARHAYRIVDEHIDALKADGYDEEQILELTLVGSLSASMVGLHSTFAGLWGRSADERGAESAPADPSAARSA